MPHPSPNRTAAAPAAPDPVLEMRGVARRYGSVEALRDIDMTIGRDEVVAILGPNGAGKTTAVHLFLGLLRPHAGTLRVFGGDPRSPRVRTRTGVMMQISGIPATLTVREHLQAFASYYPAPASIPALLEATGLDDVADRLYGRISGGQKQRLHFALALVGGPDLLFLDEPTTGLDVASRRALWERVRTFRGGGRTVVLTTHYLEEADALADRIVLLDRGRILAEGSPAEIKAKAAGRSVRAHTRLAPERLAHLRGVAHVRREGSVLTLLVAEAEPVVAEMLRLDPELNGLEVRGASLEEAFLALTRPGDGASA